MTLLEQFDKAGTDGIYDFRFVGPMREEIRRAIAIAQAVDETDPPLMYGSKMQEAYHLQFLDQIKRRADELLEGK